MRTALRRAGRAATPGAARALVGLLWRTCRLETSGTAGLEALVREGRPFVPCYWHGHQLFCARALLDLRDASPDFRLGYLVSPSRDGDTAAHVFDDLGLHVIRGSATRGGAQALREIYLAVRDGGVSPVVTPDGPTGPPHVFKPGVAMLASLAGAPLVPLAMAARPAARMRSWDEAIVPLPFARVHVAVGEPIVLAKGLRAEALGRACVDVAVAIEGCAARARDRLLRSAPPR